MLTEEADKDFRLLRRLHSRPVAFHCPGRRCPIAAAAGQMRSAWRQVWEFSDIPGVSARPNGQRSSGSTAAGARFSSAQPPSTSASSALLRRTSMRSCGARGDSFPGVGVPHSISKHGSAGPRRAEGKAIYPALHAVWTGLCALRATRQAGRNSTLREMGNSHVGGSLR